MLMLFLLSSALHAPWFISLSPRSCRGCFLLREGSFRAGWRYGDATSSRKVAAADAARRSQTSCADEPPDFALVAEPLCSRFALLLGPAQASLEILP